MLHLKLRGIMPVRMRKFLDGFEGVLDSYLDWRDLIEFDDRCIYFDEMLERILIHNFWNYLGK